MEFGDLSGAVHGSLEAMLVEPDALEWLTTYGDV